MSHSRSRVIGFLDDRHGRPHGGVDEIPLELDIAPEAPESSPTHSGSQQSVQSKLARLKLTAYH
jgi:hypothetical protein